MAMWRPWSDRVSDSDSESEVVQPKLSGRGNHLKKGHQDVIKSMLSYAKQKGAKSPISDVCKVLGVSRKTVYRVNSKVLTSPKKRGPQRRFRRVDDFQWKIIQRTVYEQFSTSQVPTIRSVHQALREKDPDFTYSTTQLNRMLKSLGFKFKKLDRRGRITMYSRIVFLRDKYTLEVQKLRDEHRILIFLDETWYDSHDVVGRGWTDGSTYCTLGTPPSRGKRIIILHAGYDGGWIPGALLIAAKNIKAAAADYHQDMNSELFETWFENQLLPSLESNLPGQSCAIIMDNAPYHSKLLHPTPSKSMKKADIVEALQRHQIPIPCQISEPGRKPRNPTKDDLIKMFKAAGIEKQYRIDTLARQKGHEVVRLPPYYCIFNPIELIWSQLKRNVRKGNITPSLSAGVIELVRKEINNIGEDLWKKCCQHARKEEERLTMAPAIEPFIISVEDEDDDVDEVGEYEDLDLQA